MSGPVWCTCVTTDRVAQLAVDDAGAGYASMRHIVELWPSIVKLDRALVCDLESDPVPQAMVAAMRCYATRAGCQLLAEGIETDAERDTLSGPLTVKLGQGLPLRSPDTGRRGCGMCRNQGRDRCSRAVHRIARRTARTADVHAQTW